MLSRTLFLTTLSLVFSLSLTGVFPAFVQAQDNPVQKATQDIKNTLGDLVAAKDENAGNELRLRVDTFRKVLELSLVEAKEFKANIVVMDTGKIKEIERWKDSALQILDAAQSYFGDEQEWLDLNSKTIDLTGIKVAATKFKEWREKNYLETADQVQAFLLIAQEAQAIKTAEKRLQKVAEEIKKILKTRAGSKKTKELSGFLAAAVNLITDARSINEDAGNVFFQNYVLPLIATSSTATSTLPIATSTSPLSTSTLETASSTSTSTSTVSGDIPPLPPSPALSIKEKVIASLTKIRDAYQVFIDMSNSVRDLLK
ncbi:MAG: hypothetical protein AAB631_03130 [Patescibacteria group bacterium]